MRISDWSSDVCSSDLITATIYRSARLCGPRDCHVLRSVNICGQIRSSRSSRCPSGRAGWIRSWIGCRPGCNGRSVEHTSELQSLMRLLYDAYCLYKKKHPPPAIKSPLIDNVPKI